MKSKCLTLIRTSQSTTWVAASFTLVQCVFLTLSTSMCLPTRSSVVSLRYRRSRTPPVEFHFIRSGLFQYTCFETDIIFSSRIISVSVVYRLIPGYTVLLLGSFRKRVKNCYFEFLSLSQVLPGFSWVISCVFKISDFKTGIWQVFIIKIHAKVVAF